MVTLMRLVRDQRQLTRQAMLDRLERRARELRETGYSLSERQLVRLEAGEIKTAPRQANRRVLEAELGKPYEDLIAPVGEHHRVRTAGMAPVLAPTALDAPPAEHFAEIVGHLAQLDHHQGPRAVIAPALAIYDAVVSTGKGSQGQEREHCLRIAAQCAELIGWLHQDSRQYGPAQEWTVQALDLAEAVQAGELIGYILTRRSAIAIDMGRPDHALVLAERALRCARSGPERSLAFRAVAAAHALGRDDVAFQEAVERALDHSADGAPRSPLTVYCTVAYLCSEAGSSALVLGDLHLAVQYLERAAGEWGSGQRRDKALCLARLALAYAKEGEMERAGAVALDAATEVAVAPSPRAAAILQTVVTSLDGRSDGVELDRLRHELSLLR